MGMMNFDTLRPINSHSGLPSLKIPNPNSNGKIVRNKRYTSFTYMPSDHPEMTSAGFEKNHIAYKQDEMLYTVNSNYFRADHFNKNEPGCMSLGCSHTYGIGLRNDEVWPFLLSTKLNLPNWNLGCGAMGADYCTFVAKQFFEEGYIPKAVFVLWPRKHRKIITLDLDSLDNFILTGGNDKDRKISAGFPYYIPAKSAMTYTPSTPYTDEYKTAVKATALLSEHQRNIEFIVYRELLISMCKQYSVPVVEFTEEGEVFENYRASMTEIPNIQYNSTIIGEQSEFDITCPIEFRARDGMHRGPKIHNLLADEFYKIAKDLIVD